MAFLGYKGLKSFEFATQLVPKSFGNLKTARVCKIVNHHSPDKPPITEDIVEKLLPVFADEEKNYMYDSG